MLPKMIRIRQLKRAAPALADVGGAVRAAIGALYPSPPDLRGKTVGIAVGSRGIDQLPGLVRAVIAYIREAGGEPCVFPAMGCHGGGTEAGQLDVLEGLGITPETMGIPVRPCARNTLAGETASGDPVQYSSIVAEFDHIVLLNRVKSHTDFSSETESGLLKMLTIGIGNPAGCMAAHKHALTNGYGEVIREIAFAMLERLPVLFGVMVTENWKGEAEHVEASLPGDFYEREKRLLARAKESAAKLPAERLDVLVIREMGKNISGTGMDTKVIGRIGIFGQKECETPVISRVVVLDLTDESHGNAIGLGLADFATKRLYDKLDINATSLNAISSMAPEQGRLACYAASDRQAVEAAVASIGEPPADSLRMIIIKNTSRLEEMYVSEALYAELRAGDAVEALGGPVELAFNEQGDLAGLFGVA